MLIGVPREIQAQESRVGLTPAGVRGLVSQQHTVLVEQGAGLASGITDGDYLTAGAQLMPTAEEIWGQAELIWKVNGPRPAEFGHLRPRQIIFSFLHLAPDRRQTEALLDAGVIAFGFETIQLGQRLPVLAPMSEVAGRLSIQAGARCLEKHQGGRGVLLGGVPGVPPAQVLVLGGGIVGQNATAMATGLGASVTVMDIDLAVLRRLDAQYRGRIRTIFSTAHTIESALASADLVIGGVLVAGARAPRLLTRNHLMLMKQGSAIVDVSVDQGGCAETTHPTTHADPTYIVDGIVHYAVTNMPGAVARTSTFALNNATQEFGLQLAAQGWEEASSQNPALGAGLNICQGAIRHPAVARAHGMPHQAD